MRKLVFLFALLCCTTEVMAHADCPDDCKKDRDDCLAGVGKPGGPLPKQCAQEYKVCLAQCKLASPTVKILQPANNYHTSYGGLNSVQFSAQVNPAQCCKLTWTSSVIQDGPLGSGTTRDVFFSTPGKRVITVTAIDSNNVKVTDKITIYLDNDAPSVAIQQPTANAKVFRNVPFIIKGSSSDINEPGLQLSCPALQWVSSVANDPANFPGCSKVFSFKTLGPHTLTLTGTDAFGKKDTAAVTFQVVDAPKNSPPIVTILNPGDGTYLDPNKSALLIGSAVDPDGKSPITYKWILKNGGVKTLGATQNLTWKPTADVPFHCGGSSVQLCLYATDPDASTGSNCVTVWIGYPPC